MPGYYPPKKNTEFIFYVALSTQADANTFQSNPTIAAGDFKVSTDGGALANLATLPAVTPAGSKLVKVTLSSSEMSGDNIVVIASDAAGAEWRDLVIQLHTVARQIDDLAFPTTSGRSIDVTMGGAVGVDWANVENPTTTVGLSGTTVKTATDVESDTADIQGRLPATLTNGRINANAAAIHDNVTAAQRLASSAALIVAGAAESGTLSTTQMTTNLTEATDDHYRGRILIWATGSLTAQAAEITGYEGTSKLLTFTTVTEAPSAGDTFIIV